MLTLLPADPESRSWARKSLIAGHYLRTAPDPRTRPFCYVAIITGARVGCLWYGRPEATRCYVGGLTFGSLDDVKRKRAKFDRWEILNLSRVWLSPDVQPGGKWHRPDFVPGFVDRKGVFRSTLASAMIHMSLKRVGSDYLLSHPPCFVEQPYRIRAVLSYCNTQLHRGVIYRASGFSLARVNNAGIETWWTAAVAPLTPVQNRHVRALARTHPRSVRIRAETLEAT
jgi:hypothetical protein